MPLLFENSFFILSIRAMAKSILGPVTIHICEPDNALSFKQSHAINRSINSDTSRPVAFFIQRCLPIGTIIIVTILSNESIKYNSLIVVKWLINSILLWETND